jgi:hypothetical protein
MMARKNKQIKNEKSGEIRVWERIEIWIGKLFISKIKCCSKTNGIVSKTKIVTT